jgi:DNA processing protein
MFRTVTTEELLGPLNEFKRAKLPQELYHAGRLILARKSPRIAIIGSRAATKASLELASRLAEHVVSVNGVVVSGLAKGIDRAAHEGALNAGGSTIAVLGTPLDRYCRRGISGSRLPDTRAV